MLPDFAAEELQRRQMAMQEGTLALNQRKQQVQEDEDTAFADAFDEVATGGLTTSAIRSLYARFPNKSEEIKRIHDSLDEGERTANFTQMGEVVTAAAGGNWDLAAANLRRRIEADPTPDDSDIAMLKAFEGDDDAARKQALTMGAYGLYAIDPDKADKVYKTLFPDPKYITVDGILVNERTGKPEYQSPYGKTFQGPRGGFFQMEPAPGIPILGQAPIEGGAAPNPFAAPAINQVGGPPEGAVAGPGPAAAPAGPAPAATDFVDNAKAVVESVFPGARVTDWRRDPNSKLGRANPKSFHNRTGAAVDVAPIPGMNFDAYIKGLKDQGYRIIEARDEVKNPSKHATGPHWHSVIGLHPARSQQEYAKVPPGGLYFHPKFKTVKRKKL
jgi:hypothetical protein